MATFVILTPGFPINEEDTTCIPSLQQFALSVQKIYPEDEFIILTFQYPFIKKEYYWHGLKVIAIGGSNKPGIQRFITWLKAYRHLRKIKKTKPLKGLISVWLTECSLVAKVFSKFNPINHFMWMVGQDAKKSNQYIKRIRPKGREIIAMSDFLKEEYFKNFGELPFLVAENGITESAFPTLNTNDRPIDILGVGSLIPLKNYELFIEIIYELKKNNPAIKATLAGIGPEEKHLKTFAAKLGLQNTLTFTGLVSHSEVFDLMNQSKVFLHTSHYEGNSTVLMEALYNGCFTFSTRPLSNRITKNLILLKTKEEFVLQIEKHFQNKEIRYERVIFNTMDASAKKIMDLFIG